MPKVKHQVGIVDVTNQIFCAMLESAGRDGWCAPKTVGKPEVGKILDLDFSDVVTLSFKIVALKQNGLPIC